MSQSDLQEQVFAEPWHAQLFATTHTLASAGHFEWKDWANHFSAALKSSDGLSPSDGEAAYYEIWLEAFEEFLIIRHLADNKELAKLKGAWTNAFLKTPHGAPVELVKR